VLSAGELHHRGLEHSNAGRHAAARTLFKRALTRAGAAGDAERAARVTISLAHVEAELGTVDQGLQVCRSVLDGVDQTPEVRGLALAQQGLLQMGG